VSRGTLFFTTSYPFNEDYALKFGFEILRQRGFTLRILNIMDLVFPSRAVDVYDRPEAMGPVLGIAQERIRSLDELERALADDGNPRLVITASITTRPVLRTFERAGVGYMVVLSNHQPAPAPPPLPTRLATVFRKAVFEPGRFFDETILKRFPASWSSAPAPAFVVRGSEIEPLEFSPGTRVINAHSFDYDRALLEANSERHPEAPAGEYYVHLECPPWECHDYKVLGLKGVVTKEVYGAMIQKFFDFVEKKTGIPIVVSAHPKHTSEEDVYGGRPFLHGTERLVRHAKGVFCHYSGAIKFAVLHRIPICFLGSRKLDADFYFKSNLTAYAEGLRAPVMMFDDDSDVRNFSEKGFFQMSDSAYDEYMKLYIATDGANKRPMWEHIGDILEEEL